MFPGSKVVAAPHLGCVSLLILLFALISQALPTPIHGWNELMSFSSLNVPNLIAAQLLHPAGPARLYLDRCADRAPCSCGRETGRNSGALLIDRAHLNPPSNSGMTLGLSLSPSSRVGATLKVTGNQQD